MKPVTKVVIGVLVLSAIGGAGYYFFVVRRKNKKNTEDVTITEVKVPTSGNNNYNQGVVVIPSVTPTPSSPIGKRAFSNTNGAKVYNLKRDSKGNFSVDTSSVRKTVDKGGYVMTVSHAIGGWYSDGVAAVATYYVDLK